MTVFCTGNLPSKPGMSSRKCGAVAEPGHDLCAAHLKQAGWTRCPECKTWLETWRKGSCPNPHQKGQTDHGAAADPGNDRF